MKRLKSTIHGNRLRGNCAILHERKKDGINNITQLKIMRKKFGGHFWGDGSSANTTVNINMIQLNHHSNSFSLHQAVQSILNKSLCND